MAAFPLAYHQWRGQRAWPESTADALPISSINSTPYLADKRRIRRNPQENRHQMRSLRGLHQSGLCTSLPGQRSRARPSAALFWLFRRDSLLIELVFLTYRYVKPRPDFTWKASQETDIFYQEAHYVNNATTPFSALRTSAPPLKSTSSPI